MARTPDTEIERLKSEIPLQRLAESQGIALTRHGADLIGLCPFHDDHEPSLVISPRGVKSAVSGLAFRKIPSPNARCRGCCCLSRVTSFLAASRAR